MQSAGVLAVFLLFAALMYARRMPALLAVPAMAVCMAFVAGVPAVRVGQIVVTGSAALAPVYVAVIFGALLARVTLDTGIARAIVNAAAEFAGEQPVVVALSMSAVVALLFVSLSGLGAIIMVGTIVLPVMMTTGVPRRIAATLFLMAFALGFIFNIVNWKFYTQYFGVVPAQMYRYAVVLACIDAAALLIYAVVAFRSARGYAAWAVRREEASSAVQVPWYALITPVLPIALYFALHLDPILALLVSALYGAIAARPRRAIDTLCAAAIRGVEDVAAAIVLFVGIGMLATATREPQFVSAMRALVSSPALHNPIAFVVVFGLLSPLALYRGPLNPYGVGIAVFTVLLSSHVLPAVVIVAAIMAVVQVQNVCDPTNTQNVWIANFTGVDIAEITRRTLPYQAAVATVACALAATWTSGLLGVTPFRLGLTPAAAATLPPAAFAGPSGSGRIAVGDDGSQDARAAARVGVALLQDNGARAFAMTTDPDAAPCAGKPYAAYAAMTSTRFRLVEGTDVDIGLRLVDCGGWEVGQWHEHAVFADPRPADVQTLAAAAVRRLQAWASANADRWQHLLAAGLAYRSGDPPSYYYALFKTEDGNMRVYVRAGGPAYEAGLRTNDIVSKIDGRFWWEYGTYQAQARAYDGKPHRFELDRAGVPVTVELEEPFAS